MKKPNRLAELRTHAKLTQQEAADAMGMSLGGYRKLEYAERRLKEEQIREAARAFGVSASEVIEGETIVPLMGYVGAGAEVEPDYEQVPEDGLEQITIPFPLPAEMIALKILGDSMLPQFKDGMILIVYREQRRATESFFGEEAVVRTVDGRRYVKTIERGQNGGITLRSWNAKPIENVHLDWVGEIFTYFPSATIRRVEKQGGIQGQLNLRTA